MYSQNDEENHILNYFNGFVGRFLDIGAYNGITFSNTKSLSELGWQGVLVEPSPIPMKDLMVAYKDRPDIVLVQAAIVPSGEGLLEWWDCSGDAVSSADAAHVSVWASRVKFHKMFVASISITELLRRLPGPYHMVNIDVEGLSMDLMERVDFRQLNTRLLCVESGVNRDASRGRVQNLGFKILHETSENLIGVLE